MRKKEDSRFMTEKREREVITVDASLLLVLLKQWRHYYYDVMKALINYESSCAQNDKQRDKAKTLSLPLFTKFTLAEITNQSTDW